MENQRKARPVAEGEGIFVTLRPVGENDKLDPFEVEETVNKAIGAVLEANSRKAGDYLLKVRTEEQAHKLTRLKKLQNGTKIKCERHPALNQSKCIIQHPSIMEMEDERLKQKLKPQGIVDVRSIRPTNRIKIITVNKATAPKSIKVGLINVYTQPYYPMIRQCRICWRIGHIGVECEQKPRCGVCSGQHVTDGCKTAPHCGNCGADHKPNDKDCPLVKQERSIIKIQVDRNVDSKKARKLYKRKHHYIHPLKDSETPEKSDSESEVELVLEADAFGHPPVFPLPIKEDTDAPSSAKTDTSKKTSKPQRKDKEETPAAETPSAKTKRKKSKQSLEDVTLEMAIRELSRREVTSDEDDEIM